MSGDVLAKVRQLVLDGRLAPFEEGVDYTPSRATFAHATTCALDLEECPICCLAFSAGLNRARCCGHEICSNCYFRVKTTEVRKHYDLPAPKKTLKYLLLANCPYCKCKPFEVNFSGKKSVEDRERELREERQVSELLRKKIEEDTASGLGLEGELSAMEAQEGRASETQQQQQQEEEEEEEQVQVIVEGAGAAAMAAQAVAPGGGGPEKRKRSSTVESGSGSGSGSGASSSLSVSPSLSPASTASFGSDLPLAAILPGFPGAANQRVEIDRLLLNQAILESFHNSRSRNGHNSGEGLGDLLSPAARHGAGGGEEETRRHRRTRSCPLEEAGFDLMNPFSPQQQQQQREILLNTH